MFEDTNEINVLGVWCPKEEFFFRKKLKRCKKIPLKDLSPFENTPPWTRALYGKKVLVIHPFEKTIKKQYKNRTNLFKNQEILPNFELITFKAVQTIGGENEKFNDWFEALNYMKKRISKIDFDIAIIGCGAYGFPLAAHIKRMGKKAVHFGGGTQLLFGILGKRWEDQEDKKMIQHINQYWVRPTLDERPKKYKELENGAYW